MCTPPARCVVFHLLKCLVWILCNNCKKGAWLQSTFLKGAIITQIAIACSMPTSVKCCGARALEKVLRGPSRACPYISGSGYFLLGPVGRCTIDYSTTVSVGALLEIKEKNLSTKLK